MCARFQADPKEVHLRAVKRIMRYLVYTPKFGLWYPKGSTFDLIGYSDADWTGCKIDRKSTSGTCQFLGRSLVPWASKKQNSVDLSTAEAEYIAAGHCCAQLLWMRQTLRDYGYKLSKVPLLCDNESVIRMANNCTALNLGVEFFLLFTHQIRALLSFLFPFRSFFLISNQYSDWCSCHVQTKPKCHECCTMPKHISLSDVVFNCVSVSSQFGFWFVIGIPIGVRPAE
jgi:hypothetical protein